jgi:hypothetical protein
MSRTCLPVISLFLLCAAISSPSAAIHADRTPYNLPAVFTDRAPKIDGYIEEDIWSKGALVKNFIQLEPWPGEPGAELTGVRVLYDRENLYVLFICADSKPDQIVATTMAREANLNDDDNVEIFIDCLHDHRTVYYFQANPLGARMDMFISNGGSTRRREWDGVWDVACDITSKGWVAEFRIPFENLRFSDEKVQTWGINFNRELRRLGEETFWAPVPASQGMRGMFNADLYGHIEGLRDISGQRRYQFFPFVTGGITREFDPNADKTLREVGGDLKVSITNNLTADFTVNTDFAQIEADDEKINLSRFSLFHKEKRDFFNEQAGLFDMGEGGSQSPQVKLFYSRRIGLVDNQQVDILGGQRLTGRIGNYTVGVMNIVTNHADLEDGNEPRTLYSVARVRRDLGRRSSVGFMVTNKQAGTDADAYNRGYGVDSRVFIGDHFSFQGTLMGEYSSDQSNDNWAGNASIGYSGDGYSTSVATRHIARDFNPEMGFVRRRDSRMYSTSASYRPRVNWGFIRELGPHSMADYVTDQAGNLLERNYHACFSVISQRGDNMNLSHSWGMERLYEKDTILGGDISLLAGDYDYKNTRGRFSTDTGRTLSFGGEYSWGDFWHGRRKAWEVEGQFNSMGRIVWNLNFERNDLSFPNGQPDVITNLVGSRVNYSFSQNLSGKLFAQYNNTDDRLLFNVLMRWTFRPGSDFYLVYNEVYESFDDTDTILADRAWNIRTRTAAAKVVYKF